MSDIIGISQISLLDLNDAITSGEEPKNPELNMIWIDESPMPDLIPSLMKKWNGREWVIVGELDPDMSVTIESIQKTLGNMANDNIIDFQERQVIKDKINEITGVVISNTATSMPTGATLDNNGKGSYAQVRSSATRAGVSASNVAYVLMHTRYNQLRDYLGNLNPKPWDLRDSNKDKVAQVDKDEFRNLWLQYYISVEGLIEETSAQLKKNVDDIEVGGRNLLVGSNPANDSEARENWGMGSRTEVVEGYADNIRGLSIARDESGSTRLFITNQSLKNHKLKSGETYTFSGWFYIDSSISLDNSANDILIRTYLESGFSDSHRKTINIGEYSYDTWYRFIITDKIPEGSNGLSEPRFALGNRGHIIMSGWKVEKGNKATDWTPAPEDTERDIRDLIGKITNVESRITDEAIINKVTSSERYISDLDKINETIVNTEKSLNNKVQAVTERVSQAENKITDTAITNTVTSSTKYRNDLSNIENSSKNYADNAIDDIDIGTRNLILDSLNRVPHSYSGSTLNIERNISVSEWDTDKAIRLYGKGGNSSVIGMLNTGISGHITKDGQNYVHSIYIKNNSTGNFIYINNNRGVTEKIGAGVVKRVVLKSKGNDRNNVQFTFSTTNAGLAFDFTFWQPQIEEGNQVSAWSPAPEDLQKYADDVAQAKANLAETTAKAHADGKVTAEEKRAIADAKAKLDEAKSYANTVTSNMSYSSRNLVLNSDESVTNSSYATKTYDMSEDWISGESYTLVIKGKTGSASTRFGLWQNGGSNNRAYLSYGQNGVESVNFTAVATSKSGWENRFTIYNYPSSVSATATIEWIAIYKGNVKILDWFPAPEDIYGEIGKTNSDLNKITSRVNSAEQKITDSAIVNTVRQSTQYKSDLTGKVSSNEIISSFNQTAEKIKMDASKIDLNGKVTFSMFNSDAQSRVNQGSTANSTINSNKSTWDRSSNINSNGTFNTSKLSGTISESQVNATSRNKWNTASSDASSANSKLNSTEFNTVSNNYFFSKTIANGSGGKWYRIASNSGNRAHGKFILRDTTGSQHGTAVFEAGVNYGKRPYINLSSYGQYGSASAFGKARIVTKSTYDEVYLEIYINNNARAQNLAYWLTDNIQSSGWVGLNWTTGSVPSGYSVFERIIDEDNVTQGTVDKWKYSNTTEIDGGAIRTNTVKANQIDVNNLFANSAVISKVQAIDISANKIVGGILESSNGRTKINLNTGLFQIANTNFELGGGADIEFTNVGNRLYFKNGVNGSSGVGVGRSINDTFPYAFLGTSSTNSLNAMDASNYSGFIANRMQRYHEDGIGNSVVGHRFDVRNSAVSFSWGFTFDINGSVKQMYGMNSGTYTYDLGRENNHFRRIYVEGIRSNAGTIRFRNSNDGYTNQGFTMETVYGSDNHLHFRGTHSSDYWNLGKPGWRFSYVYLNYQPDVSSDIRLKENVKDSSLGLDFIREIKPKTFKLINNNPRLNNEPMQFGLIAQDLRETLIKYNVDVDNINMLSQGEDGYYGVQYTQLITPTIKAVQELDIKVNVVDDKVSRLFKENEKLVIKVAGIEEELHKSHQRINELEKLIS